MGFNNTDAAICGGIAIAELVIFIIYVVVTAQALRNKIIKMGRLIPAIQMVVVASGVPGNQMPQGTPQNPYPYQNTEHNTPQGYYQPQYNTAQPPAPGFTPQDYPPAYSTASYVNENKHHM